MKDWPEPISTCWNHWIAVPAGDQVGVIDILGLSPLRPITFAEARQVIDADGHSDPNDRRHLARVFVTPEVDGWTLVIGAWCDPCSRERHEDVLGECKELSVRYGRAQAYYYGAQGDGSAWLVAEKGHAVRRYAATGEPDDELLTLGDPLPVEQARLAELGLPADGDLRSASDEQIEEWTEVAFDLAPEIAAAYGVSPFTLTRGTKVRGTGVLALAPDAADHRSQGTGTAPTASRSSAGNSRSAWPMASGTHRPASDRRQTSNCPLI
ncbi:hypothetical protein [Planobispora longispora]|uniref:Uncharacterized protein n=1 Tax=Planobispora longispora TaxID=28887 RepID=A0A8J3RTY2_9ACTN|nr:hypothetical protein [Planobispora longispora]BFE81323.1 hypothetical protein GCM10020093_039240 [Planobispora longispora]GIH81300.1 hypothetical protein Plo01_77290 [Planobispora longispora]